VQPGGAGGALNFIANGTGSAYASYYSGFNFGLDNDFYAFSEFSYTQEKTGGVYLRLFSDDGGNPPSIMASINAAYLDMGSGVPGPAYYAGLHQYDEDLQDYAGIGGQGGAREEMSGWFGMYYDSGDDKLYLGAYDQLPQFGIDPVFGYAYDDFSGLIGDNNVSFSLGGWADPGVNLAMGQATMDNFSAAAAPEPVSTALFLIGGAVLVARRLRRK
jgi:hypothetical protein